MHQRYPDPSAFNPARFSDAQRAEGVNPLPDLAYGFGRRSVDATAVHYSRLTLAFRVCPGRYLATDTIWIVVVSVISAYKILKPLDAEGKEVTPEVAYTPGVFRYALLFSLPAILTFALLLAAARNLSDTASSRGQRRLSHLWVFEDVPKPHAPKSF